MNTTAMLKNKYFISFISIYIICMFLLSIFENYAIGEAIGIAIIFGMIFPLIAHWLTKSSEQLYPNRAASGTQMISLGVSLGIVVLYLSLGPGYFSNIIAGEKHSQMYEIITLISKLFFFVLIPILLFSKKFGFTPGDYGFDFSIKNWIKKKQLLVLVVFIPLMIAFQLSVGQAAAPIRNGEYSFIQLASVLPVVFIWLILEVGLVEEFFFRSLMQSRISSYFNSETTGVLISAVLFGLAHAPGLYLRGAGADSPVGSDPSILMSIGYSIVVLSAAGIFLGVIWSRTRNLLLVMLIHASVDLLPGFSPFYKTWIGNS